MLAETNDFKFDNRKEEDLSGLPEGIKAQAATMAESLGMDGKWPHPSGSKHDSLPPVFRQARSQGETFTAYFMRGDNDNANDNKQIIAKIAQLRLKDHAPGL